MSIYKKLVIAPTNVAFAIVMLIAVFIISHMAWSLFVAKEEVYTHSDLLVAISIAGAGVVLFILVHLVFRIVRRFFRM